ncbi:phosphoenolpyruvate carboxykinase (ATP) [Pelotalea chapellei]|uniref:Phosphoenolpyruvate carboxykinase (ATP) n=1 Tax=Pelotalea chapellei TaxID=44671 RepID=A0ABS5U523_9BACT|nr:phosphoenolpyruvate carboxykinase (ATP) [Pelotalea chapellei]MBT1070752.1 phosphoenolpyruvate carboxykinase (ATP) [Pelotalea chapellei]
MNFNEVTRGTGLEAHGITNANLIHWTAPTAVLYEQIVKRGEGLLTHLGAIAVKTGHYTGRAANDKFIVDDEISHEHVNWGAVNKPFDPDRFDALYNRMVAYMHGRDLFVQDCFAGADHNYRLPVRIISEKAWHSLFSRNMFIQATPKELEQFASHFTLIDLPSFRANPDLDGTHSEAFIIINFSRKAIIIGGTSYAGEIKKSIFTTLNYLLPLEKQVLPMHCAANVGPQGDTALFFGLSGTGKTTLSTDPDRKLIGDDEHGWDDKGIFNFEGGCYAKIIRLHKEAEPRIYETTRKFGTILENVALDTHTRRIDLNNDIFTENTRASYPLSHIPNVVCSGTTGHPAAIIMLTCDAYGLMPPIGRLSREQALYHFLSGYTSRVAGTETGISEPAATFSTCFGGPFMPLPPATYGNLFRERIERHNVTCWLVNTGWSGGPYGIGSRINIAYSRNLINAALDGSLARGSFNKDPFFGLDIPSACPGVPPEILTPRAVWENKDSYDETAHKLISLFRENFKQYAAYVPENVVQVM